MTSTSDGKFGFKIDEILKTKKVQNVVFNLKGRILLLFYFVKHIHGQFKTYLKLRNFKVYSSVYFKQTAKTIPTVGKSRHILFYKTILLCILKISVSMDLFPNEQNFDLDTSRQTFHHSLKEHHKISNIPKFRCEML